jgi:hypothetical protein
VGGGSGSLVWLCNEANRSNSVSMYRRYEGNRQFFSEVGGDGLGRKKFRTSGNAVVVLSALSVAAYASLIALTLRLEE